MLVARALWRVATLVTPTLAVCLATTGARAQQQASSAASPSADTWTDPSPHRVRKVTVAPSVSLEVLDWGGVGEPVVFLAGLGMSGHTFDEFAPQFTDRFRVLAITRRGFGASSQPPSGYDVRTLTADIAAVLDTLRLARVALAGHSIAGNELTKFASTYPGRVTKLVYLDAAYDDVGVMEMARLLPSPPPPSSVDVASPAALRAWIARTYGSLLPEAEVRAMNVFDALSEYPRGVTPESIAEAVAIGVEHPAYTPVAAPALAFYAVANSAPEMFFPVYATLDSAGRAGAHKVFERFLDPRARAAREQFRREMRHGRVVELPGARHLVFISNAAEVAREMRTFLLAR
jgi:non-heme chloroperoxidase